MTFYNLDIDFDIGHVFLSIDNRDVEILVMSDFGFNSLASTPLDVFKNIFKVIREQFNVPRESIHPKMITISEIVDPETTALYEKVKSTLDHLELLKLDAVYRIWHEYTGRPKLDTKDAVDIKFKVQEYSNLLKSTFRMYIAKHRGKDGYCAIEEVLEECNNDIINNPLFAIDEESIKELRKIKEESEKRDRENELEEKEFYKPLPGSADVESLTHPFCELPSYHVNVDTSSLKLTEEELIKLQSDLKECGHEIEIVDGGLFLIKIVDYDPMFSNCFQTHWSN